MWLLGLILLYEVWNFSIIWNYISQKNSLESVYILGVMRPGLFCRTRSFENTMSHHALLSHLEPPGSDDISNPFLPWQTRALWMIIICPGWRWHWSRHCFHYSILLTVDSTLRRTQELPLSLIYCLPQS